MSCPYSYQLEKYVANFEDLKVENSAILCTQCNRRFMFRKPYECQRHINSETHQRNKSSKVSYAEFMYDLCCMFCACSLSWRLLDQPSFRNFFKKYMLQWSLPSESYVRKEYFPQVYTRIMDNITHDVENQYLWVSVDETTDFKDHQVVNVVLRVLRKDSSVPSCVIASKRVKQTTAESVATVVSNALNRISVTPEKVLVLVTDAAECMHKAGQLLKLHYSNILHVTCLAHALNRVTETIHNQYPDVDSLIWSTNQIFVKSILHRKHFHDQTSGLPLPPQTVCTRWCTWLQAAVYFAEHYAVVKKFIMGLNPRGSHAISICQQTFQVPEMEDTLKTLCERFKVLILATTKLEYTSLSIDAVLHVISDVQHVLSTFSESTELVIQNKLKSVLEENPSYKTICDISACIQNNMASDMCEYVRFAPLTSVDVKRSISDYKNIYTPNRSNLSANNVERLLVINSYSQTLWNY